MRKLLLACCCIAVACSLSAQKDWARFSRFAEANKTAPKSAKAVFMGNSITEGWWNQDSLFFKNNGYIGRGIGGQTTSEMLVRFREDVINLKPKSVVILAGTNDIAQNNGYISLENIMGNIISMAELAKANRIKVILCSVLPAYEYKWRPEIEKPAEQIKKLNAMIKAYAEKNKFTYVDYHSAMKDERDGLPAKYSKDEVHPTLNAYREVMEPLVKAAIDKNVK